MTSQINTSNIDANFPIQGQDNPSQGFRDNFSYIKIALDTAGNEITQLENIALGGTGTIIIDVATATSVVRGTVKIGAGINVTADGTISVSGNQTGTFALQTATTVSLGGVIIGSGININGYGAISVATATSTVVGGVKIGTGIGISSDGTISVTTASFDLQTATNVILGGVKIGSGINSAIDGTISINTTTLVVGTANTATYARYLSTTATNTQLGVVKIGSGINISGDGTISVTGGGGGGSSFDQNLNTTDNVQFSTLTLTGNVLMSATGQKFLGDFSNPTIANRLVFKTYITDQTTEIAATPNGAATKASWISANNADITNSSYVEMSANSSTVQILSSAYGSRQPLPLVLSTGADGVKINTNGVVNILSTLNASSTTNGAITVAGGVGIAKNLYVGGVISTEGLTVGGQAVSTQNYVLPIASDLVLGGVKIGAGIGISGDGTITVTTGSFALQTATNTVLGGVKIGSGISISSSGTISVSTASGTISTATKYTSLAISYARSNGSEATVTYIQAQAAAPFKAGERIYITGMSDSSFNGYHTVTNSDTTATEYSTTTNAAAVGGSISNVPTLGGVIIGDGLTINTTGTLSVNIASTLSLGSIVAGDNVYISGGGILSIPQATSSTFGVVKIGSGVTVTSGTISVSLAGSLPTASSNTSVTIASCSAFASTATFVFSSQPTVPFTTGDTVTVVGVSNTNYNGTFTVVSGTVSTAVVTYSGPATGASGGGTISKLGTLGVVRIGDGIQLDSNGTISLGAGTAGPASGLTGNTLASNVTASSLTSVGNLTKLTAFQTVEPYVYLDSPSGAVTIDASTGTVLFCKNPNGNFGINFTNIESTTRKAVSVACIIQQGATPRIINSINVNSTNYTINWYGGTTATGNANKIDLINFTFFTGTGTNTYTVLGSLSTFG
jgi:hypothetical protein